MTPIFNAVNYRGVKVRSFNDEKRARAWVKSNASVHEGLHLRKVRVVEDVIYTPVVSRKALSGPFVIPAPIGLAYCGASA